MAPKKTPEEMSKQNRKTVDAQAAKPKGARELEKRQKAAKKKAEDDEVDRRMQASVQLLVKQHEEKKVEELRRRNERERKATSDAQKAETARRNAEKATQAKHEKEGRKRLHDARRSDSPAAHAAQQPRHDSNPLNARGGHVGSGTRSNFSMGLGGIRSILNHPAPAAPLAHPYTSHDELYDDAPRGDRQMDHRNLTNHNRSTSNFFDTHVRTANPASYTQGPPQHPLSLAQQNQGSGAEEYDPTHHGRLGLPQYNQHLRGFDADLVMDPNESTAAGRTRREARENLQAPPQDQRSGQLPDYRSHQDSGHHSIHRSGNHQPTQTGTQSAYQGHGSNYPATGYNAPKPSTSTSKQAQSSVPTTNATHGIWCCACIRNLRPNSIFHAPGTPTCTTYVSERQCGHTLTSCGGCVQMRSGQEQPTLDRKMRNVPWLTGPWVSWYQWRDSKRPGECARWYCCRCFSRGSRRWNIANTGYKCTNPTAGAEKKRGVKCHHSALNCKTCKATQPVDEPHNLE